MHCTPVRRGLDRSRALAPRSPARLARSNDPHPVQCNGIGTFPGKSRGWLSRRSASRLAIYDRRLSSSTEEGVKTLSLCGPTANRARERGRGGWEKRYLEGGFHFHPVRPPLMLMNSRAGVAGDLKLGGRSIIEPNLRSDRDRDTFHSLFPGNIPVKSSLSAG